jgi:hypothetical protein
MEDSDQREIFNVGEQAFYGQIEEDNFKRPHQKYAVLLSGRKGVSVGFGREKCLYKRLYI